VAVKADGSVWTWGRFTTGVPVMSPVRMTGLSNVVAVAAGWNHSLALRSDGTVWAWGSNSSGQLGTGSGTTHDVFGPDSATPVQVPGLSGMVAIAAGHFNSLALAGDGSVWAWGSNLSGELGQPACVSGLCPFNEGVPNRVPRLGRAAAIASGVGYSVAALGDGTVWSWGLNNTGQLGTGTTTDSSTPVQAVGVTGITRISAGDNHALAVTSGGGVWAWGRNDSG
jgi:alpha-tubulin suppressor-like RCC1 family protein